MTHIQRLAAESTRGLVRPVQEGGREGRGRIRAFDPARLAPGNLGVLAAVLLGDLALLAWSGAQLGSGRAAPTWVIVPAALAAAWALLWRHEEPLVVYGVTWVYALSTLVVPGHRPALPLLVALTAVAAHCRFWVALGAFVLSVVPLGTWVLDGLAGHGPGTLSGTVPAILGTLVYLLLAVLAWEHGRRSAADRARASAASAAVTAERLQVARELHDIVAHTVSVMLLQAAGARRVLQTDPERADEALGVVEDVGRESMVELRRLLGVLRRTVGDEAPEEVDQHPGLAALDRLVETVRGAGVPTFVEVTGTPGRLDPSVDLTAYRVVQEALTNTVRHAGVHACATVRLHWGADALHVRVDDYGGAAPQAAAGHHGAGHGAGQHATGGHGSPHRAAPPEPAAQHAAGLHGAGHGAGHGASGGPGGLGLLGLRERALAVGATLAAGPIGDGFRVEAQLPLSRAGTGRRAPGAPDRAGSRPDRAA